MMKNFRTYPLALKLYEESQSYSLRPHLKDQLDRAASSIVLNLAEGAAKPTERDRKKFYHIALGSCREVQAIVELATLTELTEFADGVGAHLYRLCKSE
jgi:four helix bundle protein